MTAIQSVITTRKNRDLIALVGKLWIAVPGERVQILDATYGMGKWWPEVLPAGWDLTTNDLQPDMATYHYDFRALPETWDSRFDVVAYDPPYLPQGGRGTSTLHNTQKTGMLDRYGLLEVPGRPCDMNALNAEGLIECARCLIPGGRLLVKTMDYVHSGKYHSGLLATTDAARTAQLVLVDLFIHHSGTGPQRTTNRDGTPRRQVHSRRAHSYLVVFQKKGSVR